MPCFVTVLLMKLLYIACDSGWQSSSWGDWHVVGTEQADRRSYNLCTGGRCCVARTGLYHFTISCCVSLPASSSVSQQLAGIFTV